MMTKLRELFDKVMSVKDFDADDVQARREYIEAYVRFFKFAEVPFPGVQGRELCCWGKWVIIIMKEIVCW